MLRMSKLDLKTREHHEKHKTSTNYWKRKE